MAIWLLALSVPAAAQTSVLIISGGGSSLIDNQFIFGNNSAAPPTLTKRTLTTTNRALLGLGPGSSVIQFPADGTVTGQCVTTDNLGSGTNADSRFHLVEGLTVDGQYAVDQSTDIGVAVVADGIDLDGQRAIVRNSRVRRFRGVAVTARNHLFVRDNEISEAFTGIKLQTSDCAATDNYVYGCRDYGLRITGSGGNNYSAGNHFFGCKWACWNENGTNFRSVGDIFADSPHGYYNNSHQSIVTGGYFQHNMISSIRQVGNSNLVAATVVNVQMKVTEFPTGSIGVEMQGDRNTFSGGQVSLTSYYHTGTQTNPVAADGFVITGDDNLVDNTYLIDFDSADGTEGVKITGATTGNTVRCRTYGFHQAGERLLVADSALNKSMVCVFEGENLDTTNPGKYVDLPANWMPAGSGNSVTLTNTTTGTTVVLTNIAY